MKKIIVFVLMLAAFISFNLCYAQTNSCPAGQADKVHPPPPASTGDDYSHLYVDIKDPNQSYVIFYDSDLYSPRTEASGGGGFGGMPRYRKELTIKLKDGGCQDIASSHPLHDKMSSMILVAPPNVMLEICDDHTTDGKYHRTSRARYTCRNGTARGFRQKDLHSLQNRVSSVKWYLLKSNGSIDKEVEKHNTIHP